VGEENGTGAVKPIMIHRSERNALAVFEFALVAMAIGERKRAVSFNAEINGICGAYRPFFMVVHWNGDP
jgi:hypothetical protein